MHTKRPQSNLARFLSSRFSGNGQENSSDDPSRPGRPRIVTDGVEIMTDCVAADETESERCGVDIVGSFERVSDSSVAAQPALSLSPAAMFLSSFSPTPSTLSLSLPDDEGEEVAGYTLGGIIGYGGFSTVRRAFSTSGGAVAVKIVRRSDVMKLGNSTAAQKRLDRETEVWKSLSHEHILPLFTSVHTAYADFFVTLLCPAGSLFDIMKREGRPALPQDDVGMMFRQVVRGLRYLHEDMALVHRDMKLENVLVDETGTCKISDFGMTRGIGEALDDEEGEDSDEDAASSTNSLHSNVQRAASISVATTSRRGKTRLPLHNSLHRPAGHGPRHRNSTTTSTAQRTSASGTFQPGSLPYAAPELLSPPVVAGPRLTHPAQDIWALGIMLFTLLSGRLPFTDSFEPRLQMKILHGAYDLPADIGQRAEQVLRGCLERDVQKRWSILMVDEVAWGVGWGADGDCPGIPVVTDEELRQEANSTRKSTPASRSHSRPHGFDGFVAATPSVPSSDHGERSPASAEAAARRSTSRATRSLSRAPVLFAHRPSSHESSERSHSSRRLSHKPSSPNSSYLSNSFFSARSQSTSSSISSSELDDHECALLVSSQRAMENHERGRRLKKGTFPTSMSRSTSPSVVPATPVDFRTSQLTSPGPLSMEEDDVAHEDSSAKLRGRPRYLNRHGVSNEPALSVSTSDGSESHGVFLVNSPSISEWGVAPGADSHEHHANAAIPMDQEYLSPTSISFTSPAADKVSLPAIHPAPGSIVRSQSDRGNEHDFALAMTEESSGLRDTHGHKSQHDYTNSSSNSPRGHLSTSRERFQQHHHPHTLYQHARSVRSQQRAGSTPPAPLSSWSSADGGHASALRFAEHRPHPHSQSASRTPYSRACEGLSSHLLSHSVSDLSFRAETRRSRSIGHDRRDLSAGRAVVVMDGI